MTPTRTIHIGVVGCGYWGPNLIRNFVSLPGSRVPVMCDAREERLQHLKSLYPHIQCQRDFGRLLQDPKLDAIAIATPIRLHFEMAKASLAAGKHTFIEKPMAASAAECEELIALADRKGLVLMVGHTFLYAAAIRRIKEILVEGKAGEVQYISCRRLNLGLFQNDINVTWDLAAHDIAIIHYILGERAVAVSSTGRGHVQEGIEDVTVTCLHFPGNRLALIHSSWLDPRKVRDMTIVGRQQMIVYDDVEPLEKIRIYDARVEVPPHYDTFAGFQFSYHYGDCHIPYLQQEEPLRVECQHFLDCIRTGTAPLTGGVQGLEVVRVLEAAAASLKLNGQTVPVAWPSDHD
jgi:predicted dehydrogenase